MIKVGCAKLSIVLKIIGFLPLIGGGVGLYMMAMENKFSLVNLSQVLFFLMFGLAAYGYKSCLYLYSGYVLIDRRILFFFRKRVKFEYSKMSEIFIDLREKSVDSTDDTSKTVRDYGLSLKGDKLAVDIGDYLRFSTSIKNSKSWDRINELAGTIAKFSNLPIKYSDKVKSYKNI